MKMLDIAIVFFAVVLVLMLSITMISKIEKPESGEELATYLNLTAIITLMYNAWYAVLLVLLAAMLIAVFTIFKRGGGGW